MNEKIPQTADHRNFRKLGVLFAGIFIATAVTLSACAEARPDSTPATTEEQTSLLYQTPSSDPTQTPTTTSFQISNLTINPIKVKPGEKITITATLTNTGSTEDTYLTRLYINNTLRVEAETTVPGGESRDLEFSGAEGTPGTYVVTLGDRTDQFVVAELDTLEVGPDTLILEPGDLTTPNSPRSTIAPTFAGVDVVTKEPISFAQFKGSIVILNFVNYGCSPSLNDTVSAQLFAIKEVRAQHADFIPVSVFCGCCPEYTLRNFATENDFNWPWLLDVENSIVPQYIDYLKEYGYPTLIFIDEEQQIRAVAGYTDAASLQVRLDEIAAASTEY